MTLELTSQFIFIGALLALLCVVASLISQRFGAPILLVFLVLGMLAGEDGIGKIQFDDFELAFLLGSLALAVIIFDGGLGTCKSTFRVCLGPAVSLASVGVVLTAGITGTAAHWIVGLPWQESLLIGAIVGSTDAAAVFGLLRFAGLELKSRTGATLEIESGTNDPMAIFLTVTLVQLLTVEDSNLGITMLVGFLQQMGLGLVTGLIGGFLLATLLKRLPLPVSMYPLFTLAGGLSFFGLTNLLGGSGFLAIYIVGVMIGNSTLPYSNDIHRFHDGMAWLSQIGMFLMLGLLIDPSHLPPIILPAIALALVLIFFARPVAVAVALLPFRFPWREQVFIGWCGLRGAVPIILAVFPSLIGMEQTALFFELVFFVVLISLVLQGWTISPLAKWLHIDLPHSLKEPEHLQFPVSSHHSKTLHLYDATPGCRAVNMKTQDLDLPEDAQLLGVIREGIWVDDAERIGENDQVALLADGSTSTFGALFSVLPGGDQKDLHTFFGEFVISPKASLKDLGLVYGFGVPAKFQTASVADFFNAKYHGKPVVGDRLELGQVQLIAREVKAGRVNSVGLKLSKLRS